MTNDRIHAEGIDPFISGQAEWPKTAIEGFKTA